MTQQKAQRKEILHRLGPLLDDRDILVAALAGTTNVNYNAAASSAQTPADFLASSGTLTFGPGVSTQTLTVTIVGDLARETLEETTHRFTPTALVGVYLSRFQRGDDDITYLRFAYCGELGDAVPGRTLDHGIVRTLWLTPDEIRAQQGRLRSPLVLQCMEDHLAGRRFALDAVYTDASVWALRR